MIKATSSLQILIRELQREQAYQIYLEHNTSSEDIDIACSSDNNPGGTAGEFLENFERSILKQLAIQTMITQMYCPEFKQWQTGEKIIGRLRP